MHTIVKVIALKELNSPNFGKILKGEEIPKRVYKGLDIEGLEKSKLIEVTRKKPVKKEAK